MQKLNVDRLSKFRFVISSGFLFVLLLLSLPGQAETPCLKINDTFEVKVGEISGGYLGIKADCDQIELISGLPNNPKSTIFLSLSENKSVESGEIMESEETTFYYPSQDQLKLWTRKISRSYEGDKGFDNIYMIRFRPFEQGSKNLQMNMKSIMRFFSKDLENWGDTEYFESVWLLIQVKNPDSEKPNFDLLSTIYKFR